MPELKELKVHQLVYVHANVPGLGLVRGWGRVDVPGGALVTVEMATGLVGDEWCQINEDYLDPDDWDEVCVVEVSRLDVYTSDEVEYGNEPAGPPNRPGLPDPTSAPLRPRYVSVVVEEGGIIVVNAGEDLDTVREEAKSIVTNWGPETILKAVVFEFDDPEAVKQVEEQYKLVETLHGEGATDGALHGSRSR
jgi:hypothetical protein